MAEPVHANRTASLVALAAALTSAAFTAREGGIDWVRARLRAPAPVASAPPRAPNGPGAAPSPTQDGPPPPPPLAAPGAFPRHPVVDPCVARERGACVRRALSRFDEAVAGERVLRVAHLGDSIVADDKITARLRSRLQARFGDGGPGFVYASPPSRWYHHRLVRSTARGWDVRAIAGDRAEDGRHGYGGATAEGVEGATARFELVDGRASRVEVLFATGPARGGLAIALDDHAARIDARGPLGDDAWVAAPPGGARTLTLRAEGSVRVHGVVMERSRGAVVDNVGLVGSSARALLASDETHARAELARRAPALVIVLLGANDAAHAYEGPRFEEGFRALLRRLRASGASCLVMAPPDTGVDDGATVRSRDTIPRIVEAERRAAMAEGCAFWDTVAFMGGRGAVAAWRRWRWVEPDLTHPTAGGGARIADALFDALFARRREAP